MSEYDFLLMTLVIFVPAIGALPLCVRWIFPRGSEEAMRWYALFITAATLVLSIFIFIDYYQMSPQRGAEVREGHSPGKLLGSRSDVALADEISSSPQEGYNWVAKKEWIPKFNISYYIGIDGISLPLVLLTTVLTFLALLASWNIEKYVRGYLILFLVLETGMIGTFLALDFFLFYIFWEVMLLPMYFLIGVWGGPRREYAAIKFFLYTLLGSVFILIALLGFYFTDIHDFVPASVARGAAEQIKKQGAGQSEAQIATDVDKKLADKYKNSFDLVMLSRAGQAASKYLSPDPVSESSRKHLAKVLLSDGDEQKFLKNDPEVVAKLDHEIAAAQAVLSADEFEKLLSKDNAKVRDQLEARKKALDQPFFTQAFQVTMFLLLFIGFAIKVPVFPFHTWLPDAHVEAPTPISMILAGVLLKLGGYGIIRIAYPICPWAAMTLAWYLALFGVINIVYGAFAAMAQTDFKKLVAYSSVSHMGYVILGIAVWSAAPKSQYWEWGMNGAMFQMIAHGITSAGMFFLVGVIYDRAHHRNLDNFRGLNEPMPLYGGISAIIFFAALGLPGMCGFVGEFMVILSTWNYSKLFAILAALTVVLTAAYILWTLQRVYLGVNPAYKDFPDISARELLCITPLVVLSVLLGVMPNLLLSWMEPSVTGLVNVLARVPGW